MGLSIALLAPAIILACAWVFRGALIDWWYRIPVTRTWGDLRSQWPIDLGNGLEVRLGIESTRCPQWSGVLVYCLTEGYEGEGCNDDREGEPLGPLWVSVVAKGRIGEFYRERILRKQNMEPGPSPALFARAISIHRPGRYEVLVSTSDGRLLRKVIVHGTAEPFHPWMPLDRSPKLTRLHGGPYSFGGTVANQGNDIAIPEWDGWPPYPASGTKEGIASPPLPLPGLLPRSPKPEITLAIEEEQLVMASNHNLIAKWPHEHFLCRWWVNGEPYFPGEFRKELSGGEISQESGGRLVMTNNLRLELDFDPARIGARSGDRIGLQLLYLDHGWEFIEPGRRIEELARLQSPHRALLTNRVEFTAP